MSTTEITAKLRNLKELQALIEEANAEAEAIKDELKALMIANKTEEMTVDVYKVRFRFCRLKWYLSRKFAVWHL